MAPGLKDLYQVLELQRGADDATIKKAYRRLVLQYHPDKNPDDRDGAQEKIREINAAYETLGNPAKRTAYEAQAFAVERAAGARTVGRAVDLSMMNCRQSNASIPKAFMLCPIGHPDKFLRCVGSSLVFHSRDDVKDVGFEEFFAAARFTVHWVPAPNNPDRRATLGCMCRIQTQPNVVGAFGPGTVGTASFGLSGGVSSSDIMLTRTDDEVTCNVILDASPDFPTAYRLEAAYDRGHYFAFEQGTTNAQMTRDVEFFTVIDFMMTDYSIAAQFQRFDEVLVPVVIGHGGDQKHVLLTTVCKHPCIQGYFLNAMGGRFWDFSDFELYFHAHWEKWDYRPAKQELRLRGPDETLGLSIQRAKKSEDVVTQIIALGPEIKSLQLEVIEHALAVFASMEKPATPAQGEAAGKAIMRLLALVRDTMRSSAEHITLSRLVALGGRLTKLAFVCQKFDLGPQRSEALTAVGLRISKLFESKELSLKFDILDPLLSIPLDWKLCGPVLVRKGMQLFGTKQLTDLIPLLRKAGRAKAGDFGECLATSAMMKTIGAAPEVIIDALDAMVAGGFGLENVAMTLEVSLARAPPGGVLAVVAGLLERGIVNDQLEASWDTLAAKDGLAALPAGTLARVAVAAARLGTAHKAKFDAVCEAARAGISEGTWGKGEVSKVLDAATAAGGEESGASKLLRLAFKEKEQEAMKERSRSRSRSR